MQEQYHGQIHGRTTGWGAREPKFYMQTVQAAKKVKTLMKNKEKIKWMLAMKPRLSFCGELANTRDHGWLSWQFEQVLMLAKFQF